MGLFAGPWHALADLVFPRGCAACDRVISEPGLAWCAACAAEMAGLIGRPYCTCCGQAAGPHTLRDERCGDCQNRQPRYERLLRIGPHEGVLRRLILRFKYQRVPTLDALLGDLLSDALAGTAWFSDVEALIPIPSARRRTWQRRFQPTRLLADRIAQRSGRPRLGLLRLTRGIHEQKQLPATARGPNVRNAFAVPRGARLDGGVVCLIDDVCTTGATLQEGARTLRAAGAARVFAAVLSTAVVGQDRDPPGGVRGP